MEAAVYELASELSRSGEGAVFAIDRAQQRRRAVMRGGPEGVVELLEKIAIRTASSITMLAGMEPSETQPRRAWACLQRRHRRSRTLPAAPLGRWELRRAASRYPRQANTATCGTPACAGAPPVGGRSFLNPCHPAGRATAASRCARPPASICLRARRSPRLIESRRPQRLACVRVGLQVTHLVLPWADCEPVVAEEEQEANINFDHPNNWAAAGVYRARGERCVVVMNRAVARSVFDGLLLGRDCYTFYGSAHVNAHSMRQDLNAGPRAAASTLTWCLRRPAVRDFSAREPFGRRHCPRHQGRGASSRLPDSSRRVAQSVRRRVSNGRVARTAATARLVVLLFLECASFPHPPTHPPSPPAAVNQQA